MNAGPEGRCQDTTKMSLKQGCLALAHCCRMFAAVLLYLLPHINLPQSGGWARIIGATTCRLSLAQIVQDVGGILPALQRLSYAGEVMRGAGGR